MTEPRPTGPVIVVVDAFATVPFTGNPAGVCVLDGPAPDPWMQAVAAEVNLSETAFLVPGDGGFGLRSTARWCADAPIRTRSLALAGAPTRSVGPAARPIQRPHTTVPLPAPVLHGPRLVADRPRSRGRSRVSGVGDPQSVGVCGVGRTAAGRSRAHWSR